VSRRLAHAVFAAALLAGACRPAARPLATPPPQAPPRPPEPTEWEIVRDSAGFYLAGNRLDDADRVLAGYAAAHPGTEEAAEVEFQRALIKADSVGGEGLPRESAVLLGRYLARGPQAPHAREASILQRLTQSNDSLRQLIVTMRQQAEARDKAAADELAKRKTELDSVRTELDRIKRRLTGRRP
jgi:hypothetical protein